MVGVDTIAAASRRAETRLRRRRGAGVAIASVGLVAVASFVVWSNQPGSSDRVVPGDASVAAPPATEPGAGPAAATAGSASTTDPASTTVTTLPTVPAPSTWTAIAPDPRGTVFDPSVVWTGSEALVVGGVDLAGRRNPAAAAYDPTADSWRTLAAPPNGTDRINPLVVWTGADMLLVGGDNPDGSLLVSFGEAYNPATDAWRGIASPPVGFITDRSPSVWTGRELLVWPWDGGGSTMEITPIAYDPVTDTWRELAEPPIERRQQAASVWTGTEWLVWGGTTGDRELDDGAAYDRRRTRGARFPTRRFHPVGCAACGPVRS